VAIFLVEQVEVFQQLLSSLLERFRLQLVRLGRLERQLLPGVAEVLHLQIFKFFLLARDKDILKLLFRNPPIGTHLRNCCRLPLLGISSHIALN
jgi:hypothetical protein